MTAAEGRIRTPVLRLRTVAESHGWSGLAPFAWSWGGPLEDPAALDRPPGPVDGRSLGFRCAREDGVASVVVEPADVGFRWRARVEGDLGGGAIARTVRRVLGLDGPDLVPFHDLCRDDPGLAWAARRGAGRILRAPTPFEDLVKVLATTNCSWALTRAISRRLCAQCGREAPPWPEGADLPADDPAGEPLPDRAFPTVDDLADRDEAFLREAIGVGYRAPHLRELTRRVASGELDLPALEDPDRPTDELRRTFLDLPGFGPYAAGWVLRLLGRHEDLPVDSWTLGRFRELAGMPDDADRAATVARMEERYAPYGAWRGLACWLELTRSWHVEEGEPDGSG